MKGDIVRFRFSDKVINVILWIFFVIFILNTIGNLFAQTFFEKFFAILTGFSAILIWNITKKKKTTNR